MSTTFFPAQSDSRPMSLWTTPISELRIFNRPATFLLVGIPIFLIGVFVLGVAATQLIQASRCTEVAKGQLSPPYQKITTKKGERITKVEYKVNYTFAVDGRTYHGQETLRQLPTSLKATVYFNPQNPSINRLGANPYIFPTAISLVMVVFGFYFAFFCQPVKKATSA